MDSDSSKARHLIIEGLRDYLRGPHQRSSSGSVLESERILAGTVKKKDDSLLRPDIDQRPEDFYHVGVLWPREEGVDGEDDDQFVDDVDPGRGSSHDSPIALSNAQRQAAMGLSFVVEPALRKIDLAISWGVYVLKVEEELDNGVNNPGADAQSGVDETDGVTTLFWERRPMNFSAGLDLSELESGQPRTIKTDEETDGLALIVLSRDTPRGRFLTVTIVNRRQKRSGYQLQEESPCIFQAEIRVTSAGGSGFPSSTNTGLRSTEDDEYWNHELLYRDCRQFAVGHGVSVDWQTSTSGMTADAVWTEWVPDVEIGKADPDSLDDLSPLDLDPFAAQDGASTEELLSLLRVLPAEYEKWIATQKELAPSRCKEFPDNLRKRISEAAQSNLDACTDQRKRILDGIVFLETNQGAMTAFCLMSRAMKKTMELARDPPHRWRPFQLAFILLALPSVADSEHPDRSVFDLIWFPTGGGKTEAYLGLAAFILFYRYLTNNPEVAGGTAVLTRYTLRLLTAQQFERSARTIAACEIVRREEPSLHSYPPFTIGMLVGRTVTPNRIKDAARAANPQSEDRDSSTLLPIDKCPWCNTALHPFTPFITVDQRARSVTTRCPNEKCEFTDGIPMMVVDEAIYASPPSFVIATIDKLAGLSTEPNMAKILGSGGKYLPPDLIIQDELHLINDALGTVAALFEMAVEFISTNDKGQPPKFIGSTATIRQAGYQIERLYNRPVAQFPPNGITIDDSFFYRIDRQRDGRTYLGIHAQGRSAKTTLPVILGLLAQLPQRISDAKLRDPFFTNVAYFNSLRELGGALILSMDDANRYLDAQFTNDPAGSPKREIIQIAELTSQLSTEEIKEMFEKMGTGILEQTADSEPLDLVLASNMLSVGVDINRLGLMLVNGQPKTTSEYIQATSRVGRAEESAGLVVTFFNWSRPRDRSHYERFVGYHQSFYRYVEAVSVTPFSARARERALAGAVTAMIRCSDLFRENEIDLETIAEIEQQGTEASAHIEAVRQMLSRRVSSFAPEEADDTMKDFEDYRNWLIRKAENCQRPGRPRRPLVWLTPYEREPSNHVCLLRRGSRAEVDPGRDSGEKIVPMSMRDVDPQAAVVSLPRYRR